MRKLSRSTFALVLALSVVGCAHNGYDSGTLAIEKQGSFAVGGTVKTSKGRYQAVPAAAKGKESNSFFDVYLGSVAEGGQTLHGDHAAVFYQIPANARELPLVFLHGAGQSMRSWQTTPDGREGFQNIFLRKNYPVYLIDQPRRGQAGRATVDGSVKAMADDQFWLAQFRIAQNGRLNPETAFPKGEAAMEQFLRQMTPNTGDFDKEIISDSLAKLFERIGKGVLVTHSQGGIVGWLTGIKSPNVNAIVSYEPGEFSFPTGEVPAVQHSKFGDAAPSEVSLAEFEKLTKMPIVIYFGDFIDEAVSDDQGSDQWRVRLNLAKQWAEAVNKHGGDVTVIELPKAGIKGNTHFPFSDLNNGQVADHLAGWLKSKGLDK